MEGTWPRDRDWLKRLVRWGMRAGRQALVRVVGRGSREQVVVLEAVMMSKM